MNNIEILEKLVERCKECKFACCEQCEINYTQVKDIENLLLELKGTKIDLKLQETENENLIKENKELKIISNAIKVLETNAVSDDTYYVIARKNFLNGSYARLLDDYIPKSKVKELINKRGNNGYTSLDCIDDIEKLLED